MRYAVQCAQDAREREAYRVYVAESLRLHGEGKYIPVPLMELLHPKEDYDAQEVVRRVVSGAGLEVTHESA